MFTRKYILETRISGAIIKTGVLLILSTAILLAETRVNVTCSGYFSFVIKGCIVFAINMLLFVVYSLLTNFRGFTSIIRLVKSRVFHGG